MSQHKFREPPLKIKVLSVCGGALAVTVFVYEFIYRSPLGFFGNRATAALLAVGLVFMVSPLFAHLRGKRR